MRNQPKNKEIKTNPDVWEINQRIEKPKLTHTHEESTQRTQRNQNPKHKPQSKPTEIK